ncbi:MAG: restriction endonuclease subunit S [Candidatus Gastranaerophilales bacterium]|nr:restriction endonuclease subunit S [Candidatus Gastranaerophilales bacterium]
MEQEVFSIGDLCSKVTDGSHFSPENIPDGTYPMYSVKDMDYNGFKRYDYKTIDKAIYDKLCKSDCRPLKNDILIAKDGSYLKHVFKAKENLDACILSSIAILRPNMERIDPDYFVYLLRSASIKNSMANYVSGSALPRIILKAFKKMKIKLIKDRLYQAKIASILSAYDDLIEKNNRKIEILQEMAEELYKEWFVRFRFPGYKTAKFTDGIPDGWEVKHLGNIATIIMGQSPSSEFYNTNNEGLPFHQGVGSYGKLFLKDVIYSTEGNRIAEPNSIIFSVRAPVGRINRNLSRIILGRGVAAINSTDNYNEFLLYSLKDLFQMEDIIGGGTIFTSATKNDVESIKILYPAQDILESYNNIARNIEGQLRSLYLATCNLVTQRDLLLPRLMSGKLEVKVS